ncbi:Sensor histidine kinase YpdA [compost metagenome]
MSFPLNKTLKNAHPPLIHLLSVKINGKKNPVLASGMNVPYNQNTFGFEFDILTFKNMGEPNVYFQLKSDEKMVKQSQKGAQISLESLDPGTYQLRVWAVNNDGVKSMKPVLFTFTVDHPYWLSWWFILLAVVATGTIIWLIVRMIIGRIRRKEEAKTSLNKLLAEYQMNALQAQMNPHFIFNAINTIQGYILRKNEDDAYDYLSKFSKLIRMVLTNSQGSTIVLREELDTLKLYIELEQLRFDNCFDFELTISPEVEPNETYIPGMLLQPYIENAIWHGMVNLEKTKRGKLNLDISSKGNSLIITITDNGIGRELAKSFRKDINHKSMAMELTEKRMKAINQLKDFESAQVSINDLLDNQGNSSGTQVHLILPVIQYYE